MKNIVLIATCIAAISFADAQVGKLLDALESDENADNTWIVFLCDHGWHLGEKEHWGKHTPWRNSTRDLLIIVPPASEFAGDFVVGSKRNVPVNLLDIYPTLIDISGLQEKNGLSGKSLMPLIVNPDADWKEAIVTTIAHGNHAIHTKKWSYIHYYDGSEELYNILDDPEEWKNLVSIPEFRIIMDELKQHLPKDRYKQFIRYGHWKACIMNSGEIELNNVCEGYEISEQVNVSESNGELVQFFDDYLKEHQITDKFVNISRVHF